MTRAASGVGRILVAFLFSGILVACKRDAIVVGFGSLRVITKNLPPMTSTVKVEVSKGDQLSKEPPLDGRTATALFSDVPAGPLMITVHARAPGGRDLDMRARAVTMGQGPQDEVFDFMEVRPDGGEDAGDVEAGGPETGTDAEAGGPDNGTDADMGVRPDAPDTGVEMERDTGVQEDARPADAEAGTGRNDAEAGMPDVRDATTDANMDATTDATPDTADVSWHAANPVDGSSYRDGECPVDFHCDGIQDAGESIAGLTIIRPLTLGFNTVRTGDMQSGSITLRNDTDHEIDVADIAIAGRHCTFSQLDGPYRDFPLPTVDHRRTINIGEAALVTPPARMMTLRDPLPDDAGLALDSGDPPGVWYSYVAVRLTPDAGTIIDPNHPYVEGRYFRCFTFQP